MIETHWNILKPKLNRSATTWGRPSCRKKIKQPAQQTLQSSTNSSITLPIVTSTVDHCCASKPKKLRQVIVTKLNLKWQTSQSPFCGTIYFDDIHQCPYISYSQISQAFLGESWDSQRTNDTTVSWFAWFGVHFVRRCSQFISLNLPACETVHVVTWRYFVAFLNCEAKRRNHAVFTWLTIQMGSVIHYCVLTLVLKTHRSCRRFSFMHPPLFETDVAGDFRQCIEDHWGFRSKGRPHSLERRTDHRITIHDNDAAWCYTE